jgi:hypothetical protein
MEMDGRRTLRGLPLVAVASGGVVLGHWLSYLLGLPSAHLRAEVLRATGHGYWQSGVQLAVAVVVVALAAIAVRQFRAASTVGISAEEGPGRVALRLAGIQVLGFSALEVGERVAAGAPVSGMLQHHLFVLGLLVQVAVAAAIALVLFVFCRAVGAIAAALAAPRFPRPANRFLAFPLVVAPRAVLLTGASGPRGPPRS